MTSTPYCRWNNDRTFLSNGESSSKCASDCVEWEQRMWPSGKGEHWVGGPAVLTPSLVWGPRRLLPLFWAADLVSCCCWTCARTDGASWALRWASSAPLSSQWRSYTWKHTDVWTSWNLTSEEMHLSCSGLKLVRSMKASSAGLFLTPGLVVHVGSYWCTYIDAITFFAFEML